MPASETALAPDTYSVAELAGEIRDFLDEAYRSVWVAGEVARARQSRAGHLYFELVEKGAGDEIVGKLDAVVWRGNYLRVRRWLGAHGQEIRDGVTMRCRGRVDFYPAGGRLQLVVEEVDPFFTLGLLERRRRETLAALAAAGLLERNRLLPLPPVPLKIGLVTSEGSAAYHDFLAGLAESGYGFRVFFVHAATQGPQAELEVARALETLGRCDLDAVALVRGGGSRADLAVFDSRRIAEAVARSRWPVLTGLGHEIDRSIADAVGHTALKTPTKVAELLVDRVRQADMAVLACEDALARRVGERLRRASETLRRYERVAQVARLRLRAGHAALEQKAREVERLARRRLHDAERRWRELGARLAAVVPRSLARRGKDAETLAERLAAAAAARLRRAGEALEARARLCHALAPQRLLERGFSITRDGDGAIVREPRRLRIGDLITSELAAGSVRSRVEET